jgi:cobalt/nickel transport system permease protein
MGIVAGIGGYWIYRILKIVLPANRWGMMIAISLASWCSIVFASVMCALELALSGTSPLLLVFSAMVGIHSIIGLGEAMITVAVVSLVLAYRPDLMRISETTEIMWGEKV